MPVQPKDNKVYTILVGMNIEDRIKEIIKEVHKLIKKCGPKFAYKISYLTIFSQSDEDFSNLRSAMQKMGEELLAHNGYKYQLKIQLHYLNEQIMLIRIRKPDIHRKEIGCADLSYPKEKYDTLRTMALEKGYDIVVRKNYEMIELSDPHINAYTYLVNGKI